MNGRVPMRSGIRAEQQRLAIQAQKLKGAREAVMEKLDEYKQHYEEMHVQALAAELEVTSLQLQVEQLTKSLMQYEEANKALNEQLSAQRQLGSDKEKTMHRFEKKLGRIRSALTAEVNKLRHNDKDLRLAFDSVMQCVLEFRNDAITKEDFLCAVDLIFSTVIQHSRTSVHSSPRIETVFGESERERLASLPCDARKSRLAQLMSMLGDNEFGASTDEDLFSLDEGRTPSPPPVPPRKPSVGQLPRRKNAVVSKPLRERKCSKPAGPVGVSLPESRVPEENGTGVYSVATEAEENGIGVVSMATTKPEQPKENGIGIYSMATAPDSNSDSSDFEHFTPPPSNKARKRYISEPPQLQTRLRKFSVHRSSSTAESLKNSSAVITRKPSWHTTKRALTARKRRSQSLDMTRNMAVVRRSIPSIAVTVDSDDNTGGSEGYAKPFEHLWCWRKMLGIDSSILTGSLPQIDKAVEDSDLNATYLDPSEIIAAVGLKHGRKASRRAMKRVSTVLTSTSNGYYLPLVSTLRKAEKDPGESVASDAPLTPYVRMDTAVASAEKWGLYSESGMSGYASDASSGDWDSLRRERTYARIPEIARGFDNVMYDSNSGACPPTVKIDDVYASIEELDLGGRTGSQLSGQGDRELPDLPSRPQLSGQGDRELPDPPSRPQLSGQGDRELPDPPSRPQLSGQGDRELPDPPSRPQLSRQGDRELPDPPSRPQPSGQGDRELPDPPSHPQQLRYQPSINSDPAFNLHDGYCFLDDGLGAELPTCPLTRPPSLPPRKHFLLPTPPGGSIASQRMDAGADGTKLKPPGIGPLPLYTTLRGSHRRIQLVPYFSSPAPSSDEHTFSDSEKPEHLYSLGKFVSVDPQKRARLQNQSQSTTRSSPSGLAGRVPCQATHVVTSPVADSEPSSPDGPGGGGEEVEPNGMNGHAPLRQERSHTFTPNTSYKTNLQESLSTCTAEKSGYLQKMDPKQRHWTRRWFVLKHLQLKYYRTKESFFGLNRSRGTINLDSWCRLIRLETDTGFQLATPKRTYHLVADSAHDCEDWLRVLQIAMRTVAEQSPLKKKMPTVSGWARMSRKNGRPQKVWCQLEGNSLKLSSKPGEKPLHQIGLHHTTVRKQRDSLLLDRTRSHSNLQSTKLSITGEDDHTTYLTPESQEDKDSWYYYLNVASAGGEGPELTLTEKLLARILQEGGGKDHSMWKHPVLTCTAPPLRNALTSLPSATLVQKAKRMFQSVQLFMTTPLDPLGLDYHIACLQNLMGTCLSHAHLQDELYCQLLRQLSGHTNPSTPTIMQGWYLLYLLLPIFLPQRKFRWYLQTFLERHTFAHHPTIAEMAKQCQLAMQRAEKAGPRECRPSQFELLRLMSRCSHIPSAIQTCLKLPVYLTDGTTEEVEFTPSTTVHEFVSQLNQTIGMPDVATTGFALMSDWPGEEYWACFYLFPDSKLCDVIASWMDTLEELNKQQPPQGKRRRGLMLTYRNRLLLRRRHGHETEREVALLAYQASRELRSGRHPVSSVDEGVKMAAIMAQIEYGNWSAVVKRGEDDSEGVVCEALQRFCPSRFTHLTLEHDNSLLKQKLVGYWKELSDMGRPHCSHTYLTMARRWSYCGAALFEAQKRFSSQQTRSIWLAVKEDGVSLLEPSSMECVASYSYSEVSSFGGHMDDFMLMVTPRQRDGGASQAGASGRGSVVHSEKLLLAMSKLKIREATFLIATYLELYEGPVHMPASKS